MAHTTQALWIVIIALSVSCAVLLSVVIKSTYFKDDDTNSTEVYGDERYPASQKPRGRDHLLEDDEEHVAGAGMGPWHDFRLSKHVLPEHYDLMLKPNISGDTFEGQVNITVNVTRNTDTVIVHKHHTLNVYESRVYSIDDQVSEVGVLLNTIIIHIKILNLCQKVPKGTKKT